MGGGEGRGIWDGMRGGEEGRRSGRWGEEERVSEDEFTSTVLYPPLTWSEKISLFTDDNTILTGPW